MIEKLTKSEQKNFDLLLAAHQLSPKGGDILSYMEYEDALGEKYCSALIDYGIAGTKKVVSTLREIQVYSGQKEATLEDLDMEPLRVIANEHGLTFEGRPSKVSVIVAIRKKLAERDNMEARVQ